MVKLQMYVYTHTYTVFNIKTWEILKYVIKYINV